MPVTNNNSQAMLKIPGYTIIKQVGHGGMATVYYAVQETINRPVALKVLAPNLVADPTFGKRFLREARISGQLEHPQIVNVYDVSQHESIYYICMEYFTGGDLKQQIEAGTVTTKVALQYAISLAEALHYAHEKGFVHRDIKPANIMFRDDSLPVITDFGIARSITSMTRMTATGAVLGTPLYMSPDQIQGEQLDGRSDLYSLAVVLFEMLTGKCPYQADTPIAISFKQLSENVPRLEPPFDLFQPFFDKALAKKPGDRFKDGKTFATTLQEIKSSHPEILSESSASFTRDIPKTNEYSKVWRPRNAILAFMFLVIFGGMLWWGLNQGNNTTNTEDISDQLSSRQDSLTQRLDSLLSEARNLERQGLLIEPEENNALATYLSLLTLKPDYQPAKDGLADLAKRLEQDIDAELSKANFTASEKLLLALNKADASLAEKVQQRITQQKQQHSAQQLALQEKKNQEETKQRKQQKINQALTKVDTVLSNDQTTLKQLQNAQTALQEVFKLEPNNSIAAEKLKGIQYAAVQLATRQLDTQPLTLANLDQAKKTINFSAMLFPGKDNKVMQLESRHLQLVQEAKEKENQLQLLETSIAKVKQLMLSNKLSLSDLEVAQKQVTNIQGQNPEYTANYRQTLVDAYVQLAIKQLNNSQLDEAQESVGAGLAVFPDNQALIGLEEKIKTAKKRQLRALPAF